MVRLLVIKICANVIIHSYFIDRNFDKKNIFVCFGGLTMNEVGKNNSFLNTENYYYFSTSLMKNTK